MNKDLIISTKTILFTAGLVVSAFLLYQIFDVVLKLTIAFILALALEQGIKRLTVKGVPRAIAVGFFFSLLVSIIISFFTLVLPSMFEQVKHFALTLPSLVNSVIQIPEVRTSVNSALSQITTSVFSVTINIFSNAFTVFTVFIFTLYLSFDMPNVKRRFLDLFAPDMKDFVKGTWELIELNLGHWLKGQFFLMCAVGLASYIGLTLIKMPYALPLAIISGSLEIVPVIGPLLTAVVGVIVGFSISPVMGGLVLLVFLIVQQLENNLLVPRVMHQVTGFNPIVIMVALLIGSKLLGVGGMLISLPLTLILSVAFHRFISYDFENKSSSQDAHKPDSV